MAKTAPSSSRDESKALRPSALAASPCRASSPLKTRDGLVSLARPSSRPSSRPVVSDRTSDRSIASNRASDRSIASNRTSDRSIASDRTASSDRTAAGERLARVTAYWAGEGDYYTGRGISSTGVRLHDGHCAVDPAIIPYGSVVEIDGVGKYLAVDTGSAVISRTAAREAGHTSRERNALVIDLFFESRGEGERFAANGPKYASISWWTPTSGGTQARQARSLFADEDWSRIQSKQL